MLALKRRTGASLEPARRSVEIFADLDVLWPSAYRDRLGMARRLLADALLGGGENEQALAEARLAYTIFFTARSPSDAGYMSILAKAALMLARCEEATGGDVADVLLEAIDQITPWFESRERIS